MIIKTERELQSMREVGKVAGQVLEDVAAWVKPGVTTREIDSYAAERIKCYGARSAFYGYRKYPCYICISVNEQVVHGLAGDRRVQFGDIVSLDVGVSLNGYIGDTAKTVVVGSSDLLTQKLIDVTEKALYEGISQAVAGNRVSEIYRAVQNCVESQGFSIVREFVGHGVGRSVHEEPQIPNFVDGKMSPRLKAGMAIAIEPMVNAGTAAVRILADGWTVVTQDGRPSAHFEHTVMVTEGKPEILTCPGTMASKQ
ncbi:MAG TPA: type I methionyl aminopeptidase [Roseimicrobium sp.]|nr:type I methionyl aminopeptidase [Roseimicrobium sp.]